MVETKKVKYTVRIVEPNITPEENSRRLQELERVLSNILKQQVTVQYAKK